MARCIATLAAIAAFLNHNAAFAAVTTAVNVPIEETVYIPCANGGAGENVTFYGRPLSLLETVDIRGTTIRFTHEADLHHVAALGLQSRKIYEAAGTTLNSDAFTVKVFPSQQTFVNRFNLVGAGLVNPLIVYQYFQVTIASDGVATTKLDHSNYACMRKAATLRSLPRPSPVP